MAELRSLCKYKGIDGVAITDHNHPCVDRPEQPIILPGAEISSSGGHIIGLGILGRVKRGLSPDETITDIHHLGGLAVIPHPYDLLRSSVRPDLLTVRPDAIEVFNGSSIFHTVTWKKALAFAKIAGLPMVAGSDSHIPQTVGTAYTIVESDAPEPEPVIKAIGRGLVTPVPGTIHLGHRLRKLMLQSINRL